MKVKSESEVAQSCPPPREPMDCTPPGSSTHGIFHKIVYMEELPSMVILPSLAAALQLQLIGDREVFDQRKDHHILWRI